MKPPAGYDFTDDGRLVPRPPRDTADCVFACRAIKQIAKARNVSIKGARQLAVEAIETKQLKLRARLVREPLAAREPENIFAAVSPTSFTPESWTKILIVGRFETLDKRWWVPTGQRRRIPVPHWLFFTRESLDAFLKSLQPRAKRGPKFKADPKEVRKFALDLMNEHGDFSPDPDRHGFLWDARARLEDALMTRFGFEDTQAKKYAAEAVKAYRSARGR